MTWIMGAALALVLAVPSVITALAFTISLSGVWLHDRGVL